MDPVDVGDERGVVVRDVWGVPIRLGAERWAHVAAGHPEMRDEMGPAADTVAQPDYVLEGDSGSFMAVRFYERTPVTRKHCVVVYRRTGVADGFVITAYFASSIPDWRSIVWPK